MSISSRHTVALVAVVALSFVAGACQGGPDSGGEEDTGVVLDGTGEDDGGGGVECVLNSECESGVCEGGECEAPTCDDRVQNGDETDVDCGGSCPGCPANDFCQENGDCLSGRCAAQLCKEPTCNDDIANGDETDVDCGGPECDGCATGEACEEGSDCATVACKDGQCVGAGCMDGAMNGQETDVDCGGPECGPCALGDSCTGPSDCVSKICRSRTCVAPTCSDGIRNGDETDPDCGGPSCDPCGIDANCNADTDCASGVCGGPDGATCITCREGETRTSDKSCGIKDRGKVTQECVDHTWKDRDCQGGWYANCREIAKDRPNATTGQYTIDPDGPSNATHAPRKVQCQMDKDGGGWTLVAVVSDDGQDNWTMGNKAYWTTDKTTFGSLQKLNRDYKNEGIQILPFSDIMFAHSPSGTWAAYYRVGDGQQTLGQVINVWAHPTCLQFLAGHSHAPQAGNIKRQGKICETDLYFNLGDFDGKGEAYCKDLKKSADNNATFGPSWSIGNDDGCPFDDPALAGLGPTNPDCTNCSSSDIDKEVDALGFAGPAGLNTGDSGKAKNYMRIYVR